MQWWRISLFLYTLFYYKILFYGIAPKNKNQYEYNTQDNTRKFIIININFLYLINTIIFNIKNNNPKVQPIMNNIINITNDNYMRNWNIFSKVEISKDSDINYRKNFHLYFKYLSWLTTN